MFGFDGRCSTLSAPCSGRLATPGAFPRRCSCGRSGIWTWRSRCSNGPASEVGFGVSCEHLDQAAADAEPQTTDGCPECLAIGFYDWVHLRMCLTCGKVGCCD